MRITRILYVVMTMVFYCCAPSIDVGLSDLKCEYRTNPLGIDNTAPKFSWKLSQQEALRGQKQTAYQIIIASSLENLDHDIGDLWDSGKVETDQSVNATDAVKELESSKQYYWKVKL